VRFKSHLEEADIDFGINKEMLQSSSAVSIEMLKPLIEDKASDKLGIQESEIQRVSEKSEVASLVFFDDFIPEADCEETPKHGTRHCTEGGSTKRSGEQSTDECAANTDLVS